MRNEGFRKYKRPIREYAEIVEIISSGRKKICQKDINSELFLMWDAGLITGKNGKYKNGSLAKPGNDGDDSISDSDGPKFRRRLKIFSTLS